MAIITTGLQLVTSSVSSWSEASTALANAILDFEMLRANGLGLASRFWTITRYSTNNGGASTISSVPGGMQYIGSTSAASPGALTHTLQNPATTGAISAGEAMYFTDESFNADVYPITIAVGGASAAKIYGAGLSTAGVTSLTINKKGGSVLIIYQSTNVFYVLINDSKEKNLLSTTTGIDGKVIATTNLYTVPTGYTAIITKAVIRVTTMTTFATVGTMGIGVAAGEADIFASTALTGLDTTGEVWVFNASGLIVNVAAAGIVKLGVDTGFGASVCTLSIDLFGYLI